MDISSEAKASLNNLKNSLMMIRDKNKSQLTIGKNIS